LDRALAPLELVVEFYILGSVVPFQVFRARPGTARAEAQLAPSGTLIQAAARLGEHEGWPGDWLTDALHEALPDEAAYIDLPHVRVFTPRAEHVLALLVLGLGSDATPRRLDDLRYVLRTLDVETPRAALDITSWYASDRQIPPEARSTLQEALAARERTGIS
jgi:hypothetical protein